ncbi:MAG: leucine-rich repeat domain-containing protein [Muribaculaceae bacterium]|nr:leucine-rich repeat domain-containing protein [Muribaculaceae bacterium]
MRVYRIFIVTAVLVWCALASSAYNCRVDGICYNVFPDDGYAVVVADDSEPNRKYGDVVIPERIIYNGISYPVAAIGENAFKACSLLSIKLPNTTTHINASAFESSGLKSVTLPPSLTYIGEAAFKRTGLTSIVIPKSVTFIGYKSFAGCPLETIKVETGSGFDSRDNCNAVILENGNECSLVIGCKNTVIPEGVTEICNSAFQECEGLETIVIPKGVTEIGSDAFFWCTNLRDVKLPNTLNSINEAAFFGCKAMSNIALPESLTYIDNQAFCYSGLTSLFLPRSITFLGWGAFGGCPLTSIRVQDGSDFDCRDNCNAIIFEEPGFKAELVAGCKTTIIPRSVSKITNYAFKGCKGLETITIHDGVEYIGEYAFFDCTDLKSIVIPASVEEIDDNAFEGCTNLTDVIIEGHPEMGNNVFKDCPNLKSKFKRKPTFRDRSNH